MGKILNRKTGITIVAILVCLLIALFLRIYFSSRIVQAFVSPVEVMVNEPVFYSDSTQRARQWLWDFGNGETADSRAGSYVYKVAGKYQIKLVVDNSIEKRIIVTVREKRQSSSDEELIKIQAPDMAIQGEYIILGALAMHLNGGGNLENPVTLIHVTAIPYLPIRNPAYTRCFFLPKVPAIPSAIR